MQLNYVWEKSGLQQEIENIPLAVRYPIHIKDKPDVKTKHISAIIIGDELVGLVSRYYKLVQHREAFDPVVKGLDEVNIPYEWRLTTHKGKAYLNVLVDDTVDNVRIGFGVINSVDGTTAIRYSFAMSKVQRYVELVGYRQTCENGMIIRVPLDKSEFVRLEEREKIEKLLTEHARIIHMGQIGQKIQAVKYVIEAVSLLKNSVAKIIEESKKKPIGEAEAKKLIAIYVGKRLSGKILERFTEEPKSLWGLYNAVTYVASHEDIAQSTSNGLLVKSSELLEKELTSKIRR